jgi:hypothetical protein
MASYDVAYFAFPSESNNLVTITWPGLTAGQVGQPFPRGTFVDRSMQVEGTFGAGGSVVIEGSNDGANFHTLHDPFSNLLSLAASGIPQITEICAFIRPRVVGGDGSTSITCTMTSTPSQTPSDGFRV